MKNLELLSHHVVKQHLTKLSSLKDYLTKEEQKIGGEKVCSAILVIYYGSVSVEMVLKK